MIKAILKTFVLLGILFVVLYAGMNNVHLIDFHFPVAGTTAKAPIRASAALIFFALFAVGVLAGTLLHAGRNGGGAKRNQAAKER